MRDSVNKKISIGLILTFLFFPALSQNGNPLQFLSDISQASRINPAFQNKTDKLIVGLPALAGTSINWASNFPIKNLITNNFTNDFYNALNEPGNAFYAGHIPLFFLSYKSQMGTFSFSVSDKITGEMNFDDEFVNFIAQGLLPYYGKNENFGPLSLTSLYYRELAFSFSTEIIKNLHIGIRPKILFSKFYYGIEEAFYGVETFPESEMLVLHPEGSYTVSGPVKVVIDEENKTEAIKPDVKPGDYFINFRNMGSGIDLGLNYTPTPKTELSLSILDLGFTRLKYKTYNVEYTNDLHYPKDELYQSNDPNGPNYWSPSEALAAFSDSIPHITTITDLQNGQIKTLPVQIYAAIKHRLTKQFQLGFSNHYTNFRYKATNSLTGFMNARFYTNFEVVGTLTLYNFDRIFPGIGISYTGKSVQYFMSTNNFLELMQPSTAKNLNLCFGVNFLFSTTEN